MTPDQVVGLGLGLFAMTIALFMISLHLGRIAAALEKLASTEGGVTPNPDDWDPRKPSR